MFFQNRTSKILFFYTFSIKKHFVFLKTIKMRRAWWLLRWLASAAVVGCLFYYLRQTGMRLFDRVAWASVALSWAWLVVTGCLVPLNWYLEVRKWRLFQPSASRLSWQASWRAVLMGVAWSFLTPGRSGEYAARVLSVTREQVGQGLRASLGAAYSQLIVLLGMGIPALVLYGNMRGEAPQAVRAGIFRTGIVLLLIPVVGILLPRLIRMGQPWLVRFPRLEKIRIQLESLAYLEARLLGQGIGWSLARYAVYGLQYACMLQFVGVTLPATAVFGGVGTIYLIQTGLPLPPALGFLARGEVSVWIWAAWNVSPAQALWASYGLFVLNLALPALVGLGWAWGHSRSSLKRIRQSL